jgi:transcriptional regulator with XRE-family HTH domain
MKATKRRKPARFPLKQLLAMHGWSQNRLAKASGMDMSQVNAIATGRRTLTWPTMLRILTTIGADLGDLDPARLDKAS